MDIIVITIFLMSILAIGVYSGRNLKSLNHFSVGSRSFSSFAIFASLSAAFIGGGYTLGNASKVYSSGMLYVFALMGFSLKEMLVAFLIAPKMDKYRDCLSIGDIIAKTYGRYAKIWTGIFSLIVCTGIVGAQVGALGAVFNTFFNISAFWGIMIGFGVIITYASVGGMRAVVYTDILQFLILVIGIPLAFFVGLRYVGGAQVVLDTVPHDYFAFIQNSSDLILFVSLFFTFMLGETLVPPYVQRLFMTRTAKETVKATFASGVLSVPFFLIVGCIGLVAYVLNPDIDPNQALPYVVQNTLPLLLRAFVVAAIVSIIMSSAAGFLNAAAIAATNDIIKPLTKSSLQELTLLRVAKCTTVVVGVGAVIFALAIHNILDILLYAYNFWAPIILVPLVATIFGVKALPRNFFVAAIAGTIAVFVWSTVLANPYNISGILIGVVVNYLFFILDRLLSAKQIAQCELSV